MIRILFIDTFVTPVLKRKWLWVVYFLLWTVDLAFFRSVETGQFLLMLFGLVVFTIPHGASDLYLPAWILNPHWEKQGVYWALMAGVFGFFALFSWLLSAWSVNFAVALLAALIIWHYGSLDALSVYPGWGCAWLIGSTGRGLLLLSAPLYFQPVATGEIFSGFFPPGGSHILEALYAFSGYILIFALLLEILAIPASKFVEGRGLPPAMPAHALESLFLLLTFKLVSPVVGLSFYFLILHPFRHMARVVDYIPEERGHILDMGGLLKTLPSLFQRTNLITFLAGFSMAIWFIWQIFSGKTFREASLGCVLPFLYLMIPHSLVSLLTDFNPKKLDE